MTNRKLAVLGVVAAIMVIWAVGQYRISKTNAPARMTLQDSYLIQGLPTEKIAGIVIGKGSNPVTLTKQGGGFVVTSKGGYPALTSKINNLITSLLDIRIMELITDNPDNHESLSVTEQKNQSIIRFLDQDEKVITGIVIGTSRAGEQMQLDMASRTTYVRLISDDKVYLARDVPLSGGSGADYIDKELVNVRESEVLKVVVTNPDETYTIKVADSNDGSVVLVDKPAGRKQKDYDCKQVFGALMSLTVNDVRKESDAANLKFDHKYVCESKNQTTYTFDIAKSSDKTYVKCAAEYAGELPKMVARDESEDELKAKEAKLLAWQQAGKFTEKCKGWVYELPQWKAGNLTKKSQELLEEEKKEQQKPEEPKKVQQPANADAPSLPPEAKESETKPPPQ